MRTQHIIIYSVANVYAYYSVNRCKSQWFVQYVVQTHGLAGTLTSVLVAKLFAMLCARLAIGTALTGLYVGYCDANGARQPNQAIWGLLRRRLCLIWRSTLSFIGTVVLALRTDEQCEESLCSQ